MKVLVACPTAKCKDYAFKQYKKAYDDFDCDDKTLLMVDTSPKEDRYDEYLRSQGVDYVFHEDYSGATIAQLQLLVTSVVEEFIIPFAWEHEFDWIFHIESDVICPPETIRTSLILSEWYGLSLVGHSYASRPMKDFLFDQAVGCIGWRRELFPVGHQFSDYFEGFVRAHAHMKGAKFAQMTNVLNIDHLEDPDHPAGCACGSCEKRRTGT